MAGDAPGVRGGRADPQGHADRFVDLSWKFGQRVALVGPLRPDKPRKVASARPPASPSSACRAVRERQILSLSPRLCRASHKLYRIMPEAAGFSNGPQESGRIWKGCGDRRV